MVLKYCSVFLVCKGNDVWNSLDHSCNRCPLMIQAVTNMGFWFLILGGFLLHLCLNMLQSSWPECTKQPAQWVSLSNCLYSSIDSIKFYKRGNHHLLDLGNDLGTCTITVPFISEFTCFCVCTWTELKGEHAVILANQYFSHTYIMEVIGSSSVLEESCAVALQHIWKPFYHLPHCVWGRSEWASLANSLPAD